MIEALIFDFDGLLVDTEIISLKVYQKLLMPYGYDFTREEYANHYSGKTEIENVRRFIKTYQLPLSQEECFKRVIAIEKELIKKGVDLKRGAKKLLGYLKANGYKTALATSSTKERALAILKDHEIIDYFDEFVFSEDVVSGKPDPEVFLKALEKLGVEASRALVLEDSENGILAANNAKIDVLCIPDMKRPSKAFLDNTQAVFETLDNVISYLEDLSQERACI